MSTTQAALTTVTVIAAAVSAGAAVWATLEAKAGRSSEREARDRERREEREARERQDVGAFVGVARGLLVSTEPPGGVVSLPEEGRNAAIQSFWGEWDQINRQAEVIAGTYGLKSAIGELAIELREAVLKYLQTLQWFAQHWEDRATEEQWNGLFTDLAAARAKADELEQAVRS